MRDEEVIASLKDALDYTHTEGKAIIERIEKLQIALTNVLRLVDIEESTLSKLHGSGGDLQGYLIKIAADTYQSNERFIEHLIDIIERIIELVNKR